MHVQHGERGFVGLVEQLEHADHAVRVEQRDAQNRSGNVADALADLARLARVNSARGRGGLPGRGHVARDAMAKRHAKFLDFLSLLTECNFEHQLAPFLVDQEQRGRLRADDLGGRFDNHFQQP